MFKEFKAMYTFMLAFFSAKSLVEDGKINLTEEQKQKLQDALGPKTKLSDVVEAMNKELADAANKDEEGGDQQLKDLKKEAMEMLRAHGLAQEEAEEAIADPKAAAKEDPTMNEILAGLLEHNKKTDQMLEKLLAEAEEDSPLASGQRKTNGSMHSNTHFLGTGKAIDAFEDRPWNQRAAGLVSKPTDFAAESKVEIQKLANDVDLYYRENPTEVNSLFRDLLGLPAHWNIRTKVDDMVADGNIVSGEISQARKLGWLPKNKQLIKPEESKVFPVHIDIEHQGYYLQQIETSWLNMFNKEGSQAYKMSFVQFLLRELDKKARQEDRKVAINGVHVATPDEATIPGEAINRGDGILKLLWKAYFIDGKFKVANIVGPTVTNIVDHVKDVIESNVPEETKNDDNLIFYLSPTWMRRYKERKRQLFGLDNNYTGKELMEIENYPGIKFCELRDLEGSDFMFITTDDNIELMENVPGEKSLYHFDTLKRIIYIFADYKWGVRFKHIGNKISSGDPLAFKVQTVWCNMPPYIHNMSATVYEAPAKDLTLPYSNVKIATTWSGNIDNVKGTYAGQVVKITGNTSATGLITDEGNMTLTGNADFDLSTGGTITLYVNSDLTLKELSRTTAPAVVEEDEEVLVTTAIDASEGSTFRHAGGANQAIAEITEGFAGQEITIYGADDVNTLTVASVSGNISVASSRVLTAVGDYVTLVKVDGVWTEVDFNIA